MEVLQGRSPGRADRGPGIVAVLAAVLAGAVLLLLQGTGTAVVVVLLLVALTGIGLRSGSSAAVDAIVMTDLLYATVSIRVLGLWPLPAAVAVVAAWGLAYRSPRATLWRSWLRCGRSTPETPWLLVSIVEALFRGVLQTSLEQLIGPVGAVLIQAVAFGLLHVVGIPTGLVGALMAGSWGVLLGVLRHRTQGILAPYVAHVAADLTIVAMLLPTLN